MSRKVAIIGSGNWGSVVAKISSSNIQKLEGFSNTVRMWVYPELVNGKPLPDIINSQHENVKYLPGIKLPHNLIADPDLVSTVKDADLLVFITPHQFLDRTCATIKKHMKNSAKAVSFIKGLFCSVEKIELVSQRIKKQLGIPVCVVSGANVANEIARGKFAEATLGYDSVNFNHKEVLEMQMLFSLPTLRITPVNDICGVEVGGALKNIVALAAGFVDATGFGSNTKAAILRLGMIEMQKFGVEFFEGCRKSTFWESSGFADLITTCYAGRNRKCAEEFARTGESWETIEKRMLNGQKLQGPSTCEEVYAFLKARGRLNDFPLIKQIFHVSFGVNGAKAEARSVVEIFEQSDLPEFVFSKA